jgi:hypothetical protein
VTCTHCGTEQTPGPSAWKSAVCVKCGDLFHFPYRGECEVKVSWLQNTWLALCACGWKGTLTRDRDVAEAEAAAGHQR